MLAHVSAVITRALQYLVQKACCIKVEGTIRTCIYDALGRKNVELERGLTSGAIAHTSHNSCQHSKLHCLDICTNVERRGDSEGHVINGCADCEDEDHVHSWLDDNAVSVSTHHGAQPLIAPACLPRHSKSRIAVTALHAFLGGSLRTCSTFKLWQDSTGPGCFDI